MATTTSGVGGVLRTGRTRRVKSTRARRSWRPVRSVAYVPIANTEWNVRRVIMGWKLQKIETSPVAGKKLRAVFHDKDSGRTKHTDFGATGYGDFTTTHDETQKERYRTRHKKDLATGDPTRAGFLSWYVLWNKPTIAGSVRDYRQKFGM